MRAVVGAPRRDVDRDVADDPHAALLGVRAQRRPLAVEAHLVGDRAARAEARPVLDPVALALAEVELLGARHPSLRRSQQPRPGGERRRRLVGRAMAVRRAQRQHLPPRLAGLREPVHPGVGVRAEPAAGQRRGMQLDAAGKREIDHETFGGGPSGYSAPMPVPNTKGNPSRIVIQYPEPTRRRRALSRQARGGRHGPGHAPTSSATATRSFAPSCATAGRAAAAGSSRRCGRSTRTSTACAGRATSPSTRWAAGSGRSRHGATSSRPGATSCSARSPPRRRTSRASCPRASCCSSRPPAAPRAPTRRRSRQRSRSSRTRRRPRTPRSRPTCSPPWSGPPSAPARPSSTRRRSSRSTASPPPSRPGTSCSRARGAASRRSRSRSRRSPSSASTSSTSRPSTRSASRRARAATTR